MLNRYPLILFSILVFVFFFCGSVSADQGPSELVASLTKKIKAAGSPAPTLEYYHWPSIFSELSAEERSAFSAASPAELKTSMGVFFNSPEKFFREQIEKQTAGSSPEEKQMMAPMMDQMITALRKQVTDSNAKLKNTTFTVGDAELDGNSATVPVTTSQPDEEDRTQNLSLQKIDGKWYLVEALKAVGSAPVAAK